MCQLPSVPGASATLNGVARPAFSCQRHNKTTFMLKEDDKWGERPLIYVKVYDHHIVIIDSGCGGSLHSPGRDLTLRQFIESVAVPENDGLALNPVGAKGYTIICTHCHYDHIGGLPDFNSAPDVAIWASALGKEYMTDSKKLGDASLCRYVGMPVPEFAISHWAENGSQVTLGKEDSGLVVYQTPGHMPDQVAIWDAQERFLYVGDTIYEHAPILFPQKASFYSYVQTIRRLRSLVQEWNRSPGQRVKLSAGHITKEGDAESLLKIAGAFIGRVLASEVEEEELEEDSIYFGGKPAVQFRDTGSGMHFMGLRESFEHLS